MYKNNKFLAIIGARSGSKSIKDKNLTKINGKPLLFWIIKKALKSKYLDQIYVSTDSKKYQKLAIKFGAICTELRPKNLSKDQSKEIDPMVKRGIASAINFEHPFYLDQKSVDYLLKKNGFRIIEKKFFGNAHSIFYKTVKAAPVKNIKFTSSFKKNNRIFRNLENNWINDTKN